eukprot:5614727-Amphidinium_carterae.11
MSNAGVEICQGNKSAFVRLLEACGKVCGELCVGLLWRGSGRGVKVKNAQWSLVDGDEGDLDTW